MTTTTDIQIDFETTERRDKNQLITLNGVDEKRITELIPLNKVPEDETIEKKVTLKLTFRQRLSILKNNITVEPVIACYIMPSILSSLASQNLNLEKACRVNLNYSKEICDALNLRQTENYAYHEEQVQLLVASITTWQNIIQTVIPCFLILFVGAWSDKTGNRKACILFPIVGELLGCFSVITNTYFFYLPVEVNAMFEVFFPAITGGWFTNFIGVFSYIGDITTVEERTYRVGLVNLLSTIGFPIGNALSGVLLSWLGYYGVFFITASLYTFSLVYGYFYLEDPKKKLIEREKAGLNCIGHLKEFFDINLVKETFKVALMKGSGNRRLRVILLLVVVCVVFGPMYGESTVFYLFARYRFNWNEVQFSIWASYAACTNLAGTLFSIALFSKHLKLDDTILLIISNTSKILSSFAYAFARNNLEIYMAPLLEILNGTSHIALRSIGTKLVTGDEFGKVNSLLGLVEAMTPLIYCPLYTRVYMATLTTLPGAVFILGAAMSVPSYFIIGWLYYEHKKDRKTVAAEILNTDIISTHSGKTTVPTDIPSDEKIC